MSPLRCCVAIDWHVNSVTILLLFQCQVSAKYLKLIPRGVHCASTLILNTRVHTSHSVPPLCYSSKQLRSISSFRYLFADCAYLYAGRVLNRLRRLLRLFETSSPSESTYAYAKFPMFEGIDDIRTRNYAAMNFNSF